MLSDLERVNVAVVRVQDDMLVVEVQPLRLVR